MFKSIVFISIAIVASVTCSTIRGEVNFSENLDLSALKNTRFNKRWTTNYLDGSYNGVAGPSTYQGCDINTWRQGVLDCLDDLRNSINRNSYGAPAIHSSFGRNCGEANAVSCMLSADYTTQPTVSAVMGTIINIAHEQETPFATMRIGWLAATNDDAIDQEVYVTVGWTSSKKTAECITFGIPSNFSEDNVGTVQAFMATGHVNRYSGHVAPNAQAPCGAYEFCFAKNSNRAQFDSAGPYVGCLGHSI